MTQINLAICASVSSYPQVIAASYDLEKLGVNVLLPKTAAKMKQENRPDVELAADAPIITARQKAILIREHFQEIEKSDAILVMNYKKHGKSNYIGPNVLMEMSTAFYLNKPIYVLNGIPEESPLIDEIMGLEPIFLEGDLSKIGAR